MASDKRLLQIFGLVTIVAAALLGWMNLAFRLGGQWYYPIETALLLLFVLIQLRVIRLNKSMQ